MKLWGGRFREPTAAAMERFSQSLTFDWRLAAAEIAGTRAHVHALEQAQVLSAAEAAALTAALGQLERELPAPADVTLAPGPVPNEATGTGEGAGGAFTEPSGRALPPSAFRPQPDPRGPQGARALGWEQREGVQKRAAAPPNFCEDVHSWVAERLAELAGEAAAKLQTGRSRNEQVALDLRLYLRGERPALERRLGRLLAALAAFAQQHADALIPGYTHLQRAQPISLGHHALAYAEMLLRDLGRLADAYARMDESPLGSGALAGNSWGLNRAAAAGELGFSRITQNSLDAVSDRDFACELVFALSLLGVHLSRFAEDWILYSSAEFGYLELGDAYATGSSLMPQKKNPDALELIRGKSARQLGHLQQLLTLLKGLPLAYNRDLQEDKEPVFDAVDTALGCLEIAAGVVETTGVRRDACDRAVNDPALLATDRADRLVAEGVSFHEAHRRVGGMFRSGVSPDLGGLTAAAVVARRSGTGGTAPEQVRAQAARIAAAAAKLGEATRPRMGPDA
ncbi:MAG: argininosuccinate lyase [Terriglobales bacterium]